jgi:hypothetical protein
VQQTDLFFQLLLWFLIDYAWNNFLTHLVKVQVPTKLNLENFWDLQPYNQADNALHTNLT